MNARDVAIENAAAAMVQAKDPSTRGLSLRARRDLAAIAYDTVAPLIAARAAEQIARAIETAPVPPEHALHDPTCVPCVMRLLTAERDAAIARAATSGAGETGAGS